MNFRTTRGYELTNQPHNGLTPAMEDYLEMIYRIELEEETVRISTLSKWLQVQPSSASKMATKLKSIGYIDSTKTDSIVLTDTGYQIAEYLFFRHHVIERFLMLLGNTDPLLETEQLEHFLKPKTVEQISNLLEFVESDESLCRRFEDFKRRL